LIYPYALISLVEICGERSEGDLDRSEQLMFSLLSAESIVRAFAAGHILDRLYAAA
jgi:hypothetical protein